MTSSSPKKQKGSRQEESTSRAEKEEKKQRIWEMKRMKRRIMKSLAVGLMRVKEQLDDLSLQVQDCLHTMEERVAARTQISIDAMNTRLESFFAYPINQQLARNAQVLRHYPSSCCHHLYSMVTSGGRGHLD